MNSSFTRVPASEPIENDDARWIAHGSEHHAAATSRNASSDVSCRGSGTTCVSRRFTDDRQASITVCASGASTFRSGVSFQSPALTLLSVYHDGGELYLRYRLDAAPRTFGRTRPGP